ncbi:MAG: hypothetical protein WBN96_08400 [Gammaproteobacteria bacterium]
MINLLNSIKALIVCFLITGAYTLYSSTNSYQAELAGEGQEVGKIEALMHYSTVIDVWSRMLTGWLPLFAISLLSCLLLLLWLKTPVK